MKKVRKAVLFFYPLIRRISRDRVSVYAAQAAFFLIISAVPLIMLLLSLLQYIMPVTQEELILYISDFVPATFLSYATRIIDELYNQSSAPLISITAITTLWAASKSVYALTRGLDEVYGTSERRNYFQLRFGAIFYTILILVLLILVLVVLVFGNRIEQFLENTFPILAEMNTLLFLLNMRTLLFVGVMMLFFAVMYKVLPHTKLRLRYQLLGALTASLGWILFSLAYSFYIDNFAGRSYTYGSLTAVVLLMLWLYFCMYIILIGGEVNMWLARLFHVKRMKKLGVEDREDVTFLEESQPPALPIRIREHFRRGKAHTPGHEDAEEESPDRPGE